jgi:rod shape-determining protein MreC
MIFFYTKYKSLLLFLILQILAFSFTYQHHSFARSKIVNSSNSITGFFFSLTNQITEHFNLEHENQLLIAQNIKLKNELDCHLQIIHYDTEDTPKSNKYSYNHAKVINNNYSKIDNYLTLDKGKENGVEIDQGVVNSLGIVGVVKSTSNRFATVLSILNSKSSVNVKLMGENHIGIIDWNGRKIELVQLKDLPRQAAMKVGDTVVTSGNSSIFPEGIPVGTIHDFEFTRNQYLNINVLLFNDMKSLGYVEVIKNNFQKEQRELEQMLGNE